MLNKRQKNVKRIFDVIVAISGIFFIIIPVVILVVIATFSTKKIGLFSQIRVGQGAEMFTIYKIRTMKFQENHNFITIVDDVRITNFGKFLRTTKLDELPQLFNVLIGDMSLVGPRPDVVGYADKLINEDAIVLSVKPGITGPATLKFRNEEEILSHQENPIEYNEKVIWPKKIELNREYVKKWSFKKDLYYIYKTIFS